MIFMQFYSFICFFPQILSTTHEEYQIEEVRFKMYRAVRIINFWSEINLLLQKKML